MNPGKQPPGRPVLSAAAALGGKVSPHSVRIPITNVYMDGDYTGAIEVGSQKTVCNVLLDTGSSTLAVDGNHFNVGDDKTASITDLAQEISYADKSRWIGGVIQTNVTVGQGTQSAALERVHVAVAYHATSNMFGASNGILGLAYKKLNNAFKMPGPTIPPHYTYNEVEAGTVTYVEPYFSQLESAGMVANKFAFLTRRSMVNKADPDLAKDPLNQGFLILGGGEENTDLYTGPFQVARVVHDLYYNTNLKEVRLGNGKPIPVPPATKASGNPSNAVVDSGTNGLMLDQKLFAAITANLSAVADETLADSLHAGYVPLTKLNLPSWPSITFVLEGALGSDVELVVTPDCYWQTNAPKRGYATAVIYGDNGSGGGCSTLGLPLMNNYFTVFDRSVDKGLGVVSFARRPP
jgi:hypothetical protein